MDEQVFNQMIAFAREFKDNINNVEVGVTPAELSEKFIYSNIIFFTDLTVTENRAGRNYNTDVTLGRQMPCLCGHELIWHLVLLLFACMSVYCYVTEHDHMSLYMHSRKF
jgi:hypothetical protein